ncbi:helix-turn-helix domain-containing protein [Oscillibacter sp. MSJ-2]|uniref:Helix-turn-helix domain-containing protein n=1 Tax=Dysosmobacter acutus TaxID=2841504 RepID=A0ABS6FB22_9FIRM|nr:helix-turn-helix domain-containing protein [Dysosmobacter acutus]MBU5627483.1 helix-turn-helix domain-containing protein [Dysosmobacter acutus]
MSLYISNRQLSKIESSYQGLPVLLGTSRLRLQRRVFPQDYEFSRLLLDTFELVNPEFGEQAYPLLPYSGFIAVFLFEDMSSGASLCGPTTALKKLTLPPRSRAYCVRFRPGTAGWLINACANEFTDRSVSLLPFMETPSGFLSALRRGESFHERNVLLGRRLSARKASQYIPPAQVSRCIDLISSERGVIKVSAVAQAAGCSERYLNRIFQERVGVSTKLFCELTQLQYSLYTIVTTKPKSLMSTAIACGYFDQTHMNRSYRKFLDCTASDMRYLDEGSVNLRRVDSIL